MMSSVKEVTRIFDIPYFQREEYPLKTAFKYKKNGSWRSISTTEYISLSESLAKGLIDVGVKKDDKIAVIVRNNRPEWNILDVAVLMTGAQNVPIYPDATLKDFRYILSQAGVKYCFVSDEEILNRVHQAREETHLKNIYTFDEIPNQQYWKCLLVDENHSKNSLLETTLEQRKSNIKPNDLASIIYTSGTTGLPKGVMLSHNNIISNLHESVVRIPTVLKKGKAFSFLPICHVFERIISYIYQYFGVSIYFATSIDEIKDNLKEVSPNVMSAVPRFYEKLYEKIQRKGATLSGLKKCLFQWAISLGGKYQLQGKGAFYQTKLWIARKLVFSKWKLALGGDIKILISGGAALPPHIAQMFFAAGIPIIEGYGLTETSPVIAVNNAVTGEIEIGTAGPVLSNLEIKMAEDGEIMVKGPSIMQGYYKNPDLTKQAFKQGYFCTGDIGLLTDQNCLKITGRKKSFFKTSLGKYVNPMLIENKMKQIPLINQIIVLGERQKMVGAFIELNWESTKEWSDITGCDIGENLVSASKNSLLRSHLKREINIVNRDFPKWERIKKFEISPVAWTVKSGHLTPTLKIKREHILNLHEDIWEKIYQQ